MVFRVNFRVIRKTILPPEKVKNCFSIDYATTPEIPLEVTAREQSNHNKVYGANAL